MHTVRRNLFAITFKKKEEKLLLNTTLNRFYILVYKATKKSN